MCSYPSKQATVASIRARKVKGMQTQQQRANGNSKRLMATKGRQLAR